MAAGLGSAASLRVKAEATPGTHPTTGYMVVPVTGFELVPKAGTRSASNVLGLAFPAINTAVRGPIGVQGSVGAEGDYNGGLDWLLFGILGANATTGGGLDPYTNIYTPSATPPTFALEYDAGGIPVGKGYVYSNVLVSELSISGDPDAGITARANIVAESEDSATGGDVLTAAGLITPTAVGIDLSRHATKWNIGVGSDTTYCVRKFTITARRELAPQRPCIGSAFYKAPTFSKGLAVDYEFEIEWEDEAAYRAFVDGTVLTAINVTCVGGAILTGFYTLTLRVNRSDLDEAGPPRWNDNGVMVSTVKGTAYGNDGAGAATAPFTATTINEIDGDAL